VNRGILYLFPPAIVNVIDQAVPKARKYYRLKFAGFLTLIGIVLPMSIVLGLVIGLAIAGTVGVVILVAVFVVLTLRLTAYVAKKGDLGFSDDDLQNEEQLH
jgi:hypothetical protein